MRPCSGRGLGHTPTRFFCWTEGLVAPSGAWLWCGCHPPTICQLHLLQPPPGDESAPLWAGMQSYSLYDPDRVLIQIKSTLMWVRHRRIIIITSFFSGLETWWLACLNADCAANVAWRPETSAKYGFSSAELSWKWAPPLLLFWKLLFQVKISFQRKIPVLCNLKLFSVNYPPGLRFDLDFCDVWHI